MSKINHGPLKAVVFLGMLASSAAVSALEFEPGIGAGMDYTNNVGLTPDNEDSGWIGVGYIGARLEESDGPLTGRVTTGVEYNNYFDDTFSNQTYFNLRGVAGWEQIRDRLDWQVQNFFTQQSVNSLDPDTPDNTQNTNVFTFGPNIYFPVSGRQKVTVSPRVSDYYYEDDDTDNRQYGVDARWSYKINPSMSTGLDGGVVKVKYDDEDKNPDYTIYDLHVVLSGMRSRSNYTLSVGGTDIRRDELDDQSGFSGDLTWLYNLTGRSSARAYIASELRDSSEGLLQSEVSPDDGDFSNEQITGDVLRNNIMRLTYRREGDTLNATVWGELRDADYKEAPDDREVREIGARLDYGVTAKITTGVYGRYNRSEETDRNRTDDNYAIGGRLGYNLSRKLRTNFDLQYRKKDSTNARDEYTETSAFASLVYGFGNVNKPNRRRSEF